MKNIEQLNIRINKQANGGNSNASPVVFDIKGESSHNNNRGGSQVIQNPNLLNKP
jgi:hypothetical protein